ncbi:MAG: cytochrome C biosynthesis protein [Calditrichaeota bacterium]|nr:MAG: cytochrome C biosynthesis protein [Calditrichota bacterium]
MNSLHLNKTFPERLILLFMFLSIATFNCSPLPDFSNAYTRSVFPKLSPDYADVVIPPNIAPLNFVIKEPGERFVVKVFADSTKPITISGKSPIIQIPRQPWQRLLQENRGSFIYLDIYAADSAGKWVRYRRISQQIAAEPIDQFLVYRFLRPNYTVQDEITIRQRDLTGVEESIIMTTKTIDACINCHTFNHHDPDEMLLHVRWGEAAGTLFVKNQNIFKTDTRTEFNSAPGAYAAWHPQGNIVAFSINKVFQFFHAAGESRDVIDLSSDLILYRLDTQTVMTDSTIGHPSFMETYPAWSPDGDYLYFCRAPGISADFSLEKHYADVKYDLIRVAYDQFNEKWGELETILSAAEIGKSCSHIRISPDGRYLLLCLADYGNFPIFRQSSDLYMMNLEDKSLRRLEINSDRAEGYHSWSSNGRWIVFTSKRDNGVYTRLYISYVDDQYQCHKPFILPQKNPRLDETLLYAYSVPELIKKPIPFNANQFIAAALDRNKARKAKLDPRVSIPQTPPVEKSGTIDYP